MVVLNPSVF